MAGRKSAKVIEKPERKSAILSPHDELRERLLETAIDVKENIPEHRRTSSTTSSSGSFSDCSESRKRRSTKEGPAAKRHSGEKRRDALDSTDSHTTEERGSTSSSSSDSQMARTRGRQLPVMLEEEEVFDDHEEWARLENADDEEGVDFDGEVFEDLPDEEDVGGADGRFEEEAEDEDVFVGKFADRPVQNELFAYSKRHMNERRLIPAPCLLSEAKCEGIGSPTKVWSLMVKRDEMPRATRCLLNNHPEMSVSMRQMLVDWMMEVCESEKLHRETFHLAIDYVDRYLEATRTPCSHDTFQLVGTAALFIAAKYEEIYPPKCHDFAILTDGAFTDDHIRDMEILVARDIGWSLGPITAVHWLSTFLQLLGTGRNSEPEHYEESNMYVPEMLRTEFVEMCKILDYLLYDIESLKFSYRTLAAAVLFVNYEPTGAVELATGFSREQLQQVIRFVNPVSTVFSRSRAAGDVIPRHRSVKSDDAHNIQVHVKYHEIEPLVRSERENQRSCQRSLHM